MTAYYLYFDLKQDRVYDALLLELDRAGAQKLSDSIWSLNIPVPSAKKISEYFAQYIGPSDELVVVSAAEYATSIATPILYRRPLQ